MLNPSEAYTEEEEKKKKKPTTPYRKKVNKGHLELIDLIFYSLFVALITYNRYGSMEELKEIVNKFHEAGIKVLGDVVLNHRCASSRNENGIWNIFGGRLNWDEQAVVADDPHFQVKISSFLF